MLYLKLLKNQVKKLFYLINNKSKPLLDTVKSRALEIKIILAENQRLEIIKNLVNLNNLELILILKSQN